MKSIGTVYARFEIIGHSLTTGAEKIIAPGTKGDLLAVKKEEGKYVYLIKWKGCSCPKQMQEHEIRKGEK